MQIIIVAAVAENGAIGRDNALPWHLPHDLKRFKETTTGHGLLMGWNTWESITAYNGKPLPQRRHYIVSKRHKSTPVPEGCRVFESIDEAIAAAREHEKILYVIGGATMYEQFGGVAHTMYITRVHAHVAGDTFFPAIDESRWQKVEEKKDTHADEYETSLEVWHRVT